jgi:hypothetical protein
MLAIQAPSIYLPPSLDLPLELIQLSDRLDQPSTSVSSNRLASADRRRKNRMLRVRGGRLGSERGKVELRKRE